MKTLLQLSALTVTLAVCGAAAVTADSQQQIKIDQAMQIPGTVLPPGTYTISLEDRLHGRAIVRIENGAGGGQHELLLSVPSLQIGGTGSGGLIFFQSGDGRQILRGWECPGCAKPLELVYSKDEAVKITAETGQPVLAADPAYDKLPADLSPDDMKVVTLWLLSPERVSQNRGVGLKAVKYAAPAGMPAVPTRSNLPQTASDTYAWGAAGMALLISFSVLR